MKPSKIDSMPDFIAGAEERKSLSPFTYYQPFQSSFDPEFSVSPAKGHDSQDLPDAPTSGWPRGLGERGAGGGPAGAGTFASRDEKPSRGASGFREVPRGPGPGWKTAFPAFAGADVEEGSAVGSSPSWSGLLPTASNRNPSPPFPNDRGSKYFANAENNYGMFSSFAAQSESPFGLASYDKLAPGRSDVGPSCFRFGTAMPRPANLPPGTDETTRNPVYYPLMLSPFAKNLSHNIYKTGHGRLMVCNFCKNNKEVPDIYLNHYLYDPETKILTCPVLRKHVCEICGGTGDRAHTLQYCPVNRKRGLQAKVPVLLKTRTITNSTGKIRRN